MEGKSDQWRVQKSTLPALELANALRSLQKVIGTISPETEAIGYSGMSYNALNGRTRVRQIFIDRTFALAANEFPIPAENFDVLVGLAAHEAGHTVTEAVSDAVATNGNGDAKAISGPEFVSLCEEIYTDNYIRRNYPVQYEYLEKARKAYDAQADKEGHLPDFNNINSTGIYKYVYKGTVSWDSIPPEHTQVYALLENLAAVLSNSDMAHYKRATLYQQSYETIRGMLGVHVSNLKKQLSKNFQEDDIPKSLRRRYGPSEQTMDFGDDLEPDEKDRAAGDSDDDAMTSDPMHGEDRPKPLAEEIITEQVEQRQIMHDTDKTDEERNDAKKKLKELGKQIPLAKLLDEVQEHIESNTEDMTNQMVKIVEESNEGDSHRLEQITGSMNTTPTTHSNSRQPHMGKPVGEVMDLVKDLDWMKRIKNTMLRQTIRSQAEGLLDKRRLYKHNIDGLVYKKRHTLQQEDLELVLLLDSSSSMRSDSLVYKAANALHTILPDAKILSYAEGRGTTKLEDCAWDGKLRRIIPQGNTPSGKALLVTAMKHPKSLIIHFSDGEANHDVRPRDIIPVIAKKFPKVQIANILENGSRLGIIEYAGDGKPHENSTVRSLSTLEQFPDALKEAIEPWYRSR